MKKLEKEYTVMKIKEQEEMVELRVCIWPIFSRPVCYIHYIKQNSKDYLSDVLSDEEYF